MKTPLVKDSERLKAIVVEHVPGNVLSAAAREGWVGVTPSEVELKVCSGYGGSATFKVTRAGATTAGAFALHVYSREHSKNVRFRKRGSAASAALWAAGMAPERVAETHEWYLDVWSGGKPMDGEERDLTAKIGRYSCCLSLLIFCCSFCSLPPSFLPRSGSLIGPTCAYCAKQVHRQAPRGANSVV